METLIFQIETIAQRWFELMVASSVQLGIFIALVTALTLLFRKQSAKFLYWLWLIGLLKIFIPPVIKLPAFLSKSKIILDNTIPTIIFSEIRFATFPEPKLNYEGYLFLFWGFTLLILLAFWIFKMLQLNKTVSRSSYEVSKKIVALLDFETTNRIRFFSGPGIAMPFTKGLFSPKIYIPETALIWSDSELKALIFHEIAHIKGKDILVIAIQNVIQLLYFFHPMVWIANIKISRYREKACDDFAIFALNGKYVEYGKLLLKSIDQVVGWKPIPTMTTYFHQSKKFLIHRFEYILNKKGSIMTKLNAIQRLALVGLVMLGIVFSCQKKEQPNQPEQVVLGDNVVIELSKETLQVGLADSQKVDYDSPPIPVGGIEVFHRYFNFPPSYKNLELIINVKIDKMGNPTSVQFKLSPGKKLPDAYSEGYFNGRLSALSALIKRTKWMPASKNGQPIAAWITVPLRYDSKEVVAGEIKETIAEVPPPPGDEDAVFVAYHEAPEPIGGFTAIQENLVYPELARKACIEGTVTVQAQISESGEVINTRILQSLGENNGCNEAAVAAIKAVKWIPAKKGNTPVTVWISIPVRFKLRGDAKVEAEKIADNLDELKARRKELQPPPPPEGADEYFVPYDEPPEPIGGFTAIQKNLVYPELARKAGIEGTVVVMAQISENGDVLKTNIHRSLGEDNGCDEAAIEAIRSIKWTPAKYEGKPVAVWISVPVKFRLR